MAPKVDLSILTKKYTDKLSFFEDLTSKKMFGGVGLFTDGIMFAMITKEGEFRLRVDDTNRSDFEKLKSEGYYSASKGKGMPYYEVPDEIAKDEHKFKEWTQKAYQVALNNKKK